MTPQRQFPTVNVSARDWTGWQPACARSSSAKGSAEISLQNDTKLSEIALNFSADDDHYVSHEQKHLVEWVCHPVTRKHFDNYLPNVKKVFRFFLLTHDKNLLLLCRFL